MRLKGSITDAVEQYTQAKALRKERYAAARENSARVAGEAVRSLLSGEDCADAERLLGTEIAALRTLYYSMCKEYDPANFVPSAQLNKRAVSFWQRVAARWREADCSPEQFMRAQFKWFQKHFGTTPAVLQLTTEAAVERAKTFVGDVSKPVVSVAPAANVPMAEVFRQSELLIQGIMQAQGVSSREEFYRDFVLTGLVTFPEKFLKADPAYRKVRNER